MKIIINNLFLLLTLLLLASCNSAKDIVYFQEFEKINGSPLTEDFDLKIKKDDQLSINVFAKEFELVAHFNKQYSGGLSNNQQNMQMNQNNQNLSYLVDKYGEIDFPVFGKLRVEGMSRTQLSDTLAQLLITNGYVQQPLVDVRMANFKVTVLGEVGTPGVQTFDTERATILDAIAKAGDITIYGRRKLVKLMRETNGQRNVYTIDMQDPNIVNSPLFYLQQNDFVYVEPNNLKATQGNYFGFISSLFGVISLLTSLIVIFTR